MTAIIQTENVNVSYGKHQVIYDTSLSFPEHEITALIGPSGSGKSTYLRCLNRSNDLVNNVNVSGKILFNNHDIYARSTNVVKLRTQVGMVYQAPKPFPFSIFDCVSFSQRMAGNHDKQMLNEIVESSLRQASIWDEVKDRLQDNAFGLSGGQKQRICIAAVLAAKPDVILLDEPTSALDPVATGKIEETLIELKKRYTIIIVTHNMQQASRIADSVGFFLNGRLVEHNPTKKIFLTPEKQETSDYLNGKFG